MLGLIQHAGSTKDGGSSNDGHPVRAQTRPGRDREVATYMTTTHVADRSPRLRAAGWALHAYTASGTAIAFLALAVALTPDGGHGVMRLDVLPRSG